MTKKHFKLKKWRLFENFDIEFQENHIVYQNFTRINKVLKYYQQSNNPSNLKIG